MCTVAAILKFLVVLFHTFNVLYFYISTFRSVCAVPNMAVFLSSMISWFPGVLLRYFLNDFEMVSVPPVVFTFPLRYISIVRSLNL